MVCFASEDELHSKNYNVFAGKSPTANDMFVLSHGFCVFFMIILFLNLVENWYKMVFDSVHCSFSSVVFHLTIVKLNLFMFFFGGVCSKHLLNWFSCPPPWFFIVC